MESKPMDSYTIYCTESQTKKALALGAQIIQTHANPSRSFVSKYPMRIWVSTDDRYVDAGYVLAIPTAEQMICWLEGECGFEFYIMKDVCWYVDVIHGHNWYFSKENYSSRPEATLAAIDAALDYLINSKK